MASNLDELVKHFEMKTEKLNKMLQLRGLEPKDGTEAAETLRAIDNEVTEIENIIDDFREYVSNEKKSLKKAEHVKEVLEVYIKRTQYIAAHLPEHLPGKKSDDSVKALKEKNNPVTGTRPSMKTATTGRAGPATGTFNEICYLTTEEFETVPKYLKGRLTYKQVNSAIDEFNKVLAAKYKILGSSRRGMSDVVMRKYRAFKEQESVETKGCSFFIDKDIKEYSSFKLDKRGQTILSILRHCGKMRELRSGKVVRFVVVS